MIYIRKPFANIGDKTPIPFDTVPSGEVSFEQGYTADYQADQTSDPNAKDIERAKFNWFWGAISENQKDWQEKTFPDWIGDKGDGTPFAYPKNAIVRYTDGNSYASLIDNNTQVPTGANWKLFDIESLDNTVKLTGDQTIAGVKTFSSSPIVPTPTADNQAVNKAYADLKVALESFTGANQMLASSGYQKLPGGLIIQWGNFNIASGSGGVTGNFNITFPNNCFTMVGSPQSTTTIIISSFNSSSFEVDESASPGTLMRWFAIGY